MTLAGVSACKPLLVRKMTALHSVSTYVHDVTREHLWGTTTERSGRWLLRTTIPASSIATSRPNRRCSPSISAACRRSVHPLRRRAFRKAKGRETLFDAYGMLKSPPSLVLIGCYKRDAPKHFPPQAVVLPELPHAFEGVTPDP